MALVLYGSSHHFGDHLAQIRVGHLPGWMAIHRKSALILAFCTTLARADGTGRIAGFVKFPGETPPRNMFANASDHDCPHGIPQTHLLVKQETRGLQNALVVLDRRDRRVMPTPLQAEL